MMAEGYDIVTGNLEPTGDVCNEFIGIGIFWSISCAPRLALALVPNWTYLGRDLPPTADINTVLSASGNIEAAA